MPSAKLTIEDVVNINEHSADHPAFFFEHVLGIELWPKQLEVVESLVNNRVTTVRSNHSAGKSFTASAAAFWFLMTHPESIVVTTAPTFRQVKDVLWREIRTRYAKAKVPLGKRAPNVTGWELDGNWYAVGLSTKDPDKFQGYHADSGYLLCIVDEAAGMEEPLFEAIDAILTSAECRLLMIGNPTSSSGTFRDSHKPASGDSKIRISAFDTPNFTANNIKDENDLTEAIESKRPLNIVANYLISPIWVYERVKKWGIKSPMYRARVLGEFPVIGENNLIPLDWIEAACTTARLDRVLGLSLPDDTPDTEAENNAARRNALESYIKSRNVVYGVDVARSGSDSTVIQPRYDKILMAASTYHKQDTMETAGRVWAMLHHDVHEIVNVDVIGVGGGVVDRLHELQAEQRALGKPQPARIIGVNVAERPEADDKNRILPAHMNYANKRAELYWRLRDKFEIGDIYIMPDEYGNPPEDLLDELSSVQYKYLGDKIFIEEKAEMKKRLNGKSPDHADAAILSFANSNVGTYDKIGLDRTDHPKSDTFFRHETNGQPIFRGIMGGRNKNPF